LTPSIQDTAALEVTDRDVDSRAKGRVRPVFGSECEGQGIGGK
jgi:hypothetical protein